MSSLAPPLTVTIRPMRLEDLDQVYEIELRCFPTPWSRRSYVFELTQNRASRLWVAEAETPESEARIAGMVVMWLLADQAHISNIAVDALYRRQGIACRLLHTALAEGVRLGAVEATLEVRQSNTAAIGLYRRFGFVQVGRRKAYYHDNGEDAILMTAPNLNRERLAQIECPEKPLEL